MSHGMEDDLTSYLQEGWMVRLVEKVFTIKIRNTIYNTCLRFHNEVTITLT